ncbi:MAG: response regulator [Rubrivivax sp.]|nr:response regulator [Rubrivivax sp.]
MPHRVAFLGFTESERHALSSYFRLGHNRIPSYAHVATLTDADLLVADADHAPSVQLVMATERLVETVFIGAQAPVGSAAWMRRPIDALQVMRELDGIVGRLTLGRPVRDDGGQHTTIIQAMRRKRETETAPAAAPVLLGDLPFGAPDPAGTAVAAPPAAAGWPAEGGPAPLAGPQLQEVVPATFDEAPSHPLPLTLRDPPTPAAGEADTPPGADLFPGGEGLVGHEPPLPAAPGGWSEDLTALHALPVLREPIPEPAAAAEPARADAPPPSPAPPVTAAAAPLPGPAPVAALQPLAAAPAPAKAPKPPKVPKATLLPVQPRALLVDDSVIALLFLEKRLERWQIQTDPASNSQAALALLAQHSYDLVFLDVELGQDSELDGLGLCRQIKHTPASMNALVVMVSAHHGELDRVRGALAGCDGYLGKPLDEAELQRLLQRQGLRPKSEAGSVPG